MVNQQKQVGRARTAFVTGAAGTLGRAICHELSRRGYELAISDIDAHSCESLRAELSKKGGTAVSYRLDVTNAGDWQSIYDELRASWQHLDVLVNTAGCMMAGELTKTSWEQWSRVVEVNLHGTALGCHTFADWLVDPSHSNHVMNIASIASFLPLAWGSAYSVSKAGVLALSESLQVEWQSRNVRVTAVCPGFFESGLFEHGSFADELMEKVAGHFVKTAVITADDVAFAAVEGMERGKQYVILPWRARWLQRFKRIAPATFVRTVSRQAHRLRASLRDES